MSTLLFDGSNSISIMKLLGASVTWLSHEFNKVESTYLELAQLEYCDASSNAIAFKKLSVTKILSISNCIAIGTDNASVMVGTNDVVYGLI